ncbi:MAG: hypothetical protein ACPGYP_07665 [Solirubrobacterales bacterium]
MKEREPMWEGWTNAEIAAATRVPEAQIPAAGSPELRYIIKRRMVRTHVPLQVLDRAFARWRIQYLTRRERIVRAIQLGIFRLVGLRKPVSAVALTKFISAEDVPDPPDGDWLRLMYRDSRTHFNQFLRVLGLTSGNWWIRSVDERELAGVVPVIVEELGPPEELGLVQRLRGGSFPILVHDSLPNALNEALVSHDAVGSAAFLLGETKAGRMDTLSTMSMLHDAHSEIVAGRNDQGIVLAVTAIEMAVAAILRVGGPMAGWQESQTKKALNAEFRQRIEHHLSSLFQVKIDLDSRAVWAAWWQTAYKSRNRIVHEGADLSHSEAIEGWEATQDLIDELTELLGEVNALKGLHEQMSRFSRFESAASIEF